MMDDHAFDRQEQELALRFADFAEEAAKALGAKPRCVEAFRALIHAAGALGALHGVITARYGRHVSDPKALKKGKFLAGLRGVMRDLQQEFENVCLRRGPKRAPRGGTLHGYH